MPRDIFTMLIASMLLVLGSLSAIAEENGQGISPAEVGDRLSKMREDPNSVSVPLVLEQAERLPPKYQFLNVYNQLFWKSSNLNFFRSEDYEFLVRKFYLTLILNQRGNGDITRFRQYMTSLNFRLFPLSGVGELSSEKLTKAQCFIQHDNVEQPALRVLKSTEFKECIRKNN